jgi:2-keto-3-deoxy-L-rhamnonate aldolase RhmA
MPIYPNITLDHMRAGKTALGFGVHHLRTSAVPLLAKAAGYHWLFIDMEHGAFSVAEAAQLCIAALPVGITPIVRVCADALDEATRALDNGAQGIVVPHVDTPAQADRIAEAFRFPPHGRRSWGGPAAIYGFDPPPVAVAQEEIDRTIVVVAMIETEEAVANADAIAGTTGIDVLLIGTSDLTADMGISGQMGHARVRQAYENVAAACTRHSKILGMGGVYDEENARRYIGMGARFVLGGTDQSFLLSGASARSRFLAGLG